MKMRPEFLVVLLLGLFAAWDARAQTEVPLSATEAIERGMLEDLPLPTGITRAPEDQMLRNTQPPLAGPVDPELYRVGPGDVFQIQISGRVTRNWVIQVGPEGYILIPGSGGTPVAGRTLAAARTEIVSLLQRRFRDVGVDVRLSRPRTFQVYFTGQVKSPGPVSVVGSSRVADVLTEGLMQGDASHRRIEVTHTDGTRETADLVLFTRMGDPSANPWLRDGDIVNVPVAVEWIWSHGALAQAGQLELGPRDSLLTLFRLSGDPLPAADIQHALLVRWQDPFRPESLWVQLDEVYGRRTNPQLRDGDRLYVYYLPQYHLQHEVAVFGEVARPGVYPISEGRHHLSDLVKAAGGFLPTADLSAIRVHRRNPGATEKDPELDRLLRMSREQLTASEYVKMTTKIAGLREDYRVDWARLMASPALDLLLRDGDVVRVERLVSSIRIDGEVRRPGILSYRPGLKVEDYVKQAGGFSDRAWKQRIRVTRAVTGQTLPARSVTSLDPGDFVWIPERPDKSFLDYTRETLTTLAQIATVVIAVRSVK